MKTAPKKQQIYLPKKLPDRNFNPTDDKSWLTADEATAYLKLSSVCSLRNLVYEKRIPHYKLGRLLRFKTCELDQLIESTKIERRL